MSPHVRKRGGVCSQESRQEVALSLGRNTASVRLAEAFKALVTGRTQIHDALADERVLAPQTGLPAGRIHNALASGLLQRLFPKDMMKVNFDARARSFRVPPTFGMDWRT